MSKIDYQALREAAQLATQGEWVAFISSGTGTYAVHTPGDKRCEDVIKWTGFDGQNNAENNARYIAAANPAAVLALLDELEAAENRIDELEPLMAPQLTRQAVVSVPEVVGWEDVPEEITEDDITLASAWAHGFNQCRAAMLQYADDSLAHEGKNHPEDKLGMVDHFGGSNNMVGPVTDNTNQQFESLSRGDK